MKQNKNGQCLVSSSKIIFLVPLTIFVIHIIFNINTFNKQYLYNMIEAADGNLTKKITNNRAKIILQIYKFLKSHPHQNIVTIKTIRDNEQQIDMERGISDFYKIEEVTGKYGKNELLIAFVLGSKGIDHLHHYNILHCDIKLDNFILFKIQYGDKKYKLIGKLNDFQYCNLPTLDTSQDQNYSLLNPQKQHLKHIFKLEKQISNNPLLTNLSPFDNNKSTQKSRGNYSENTLKKKDQYQYFGLAYLNLCLNMYLNLNNVVDKKAWQNKTQQLIRQFKALELKLSEEYKYIINKRQLEDYDRQIKAITINLIAQYYKFQKSENVLQNHQNKENIWQESYFKEIITAVAYLFISNPYKMKSLKHFRYQIIQKLNPKQNELNLFNKDQQYLQDVRNFIGILIQLVRLEQQEVMKIKIKQTKFQSKQGLIDIQAQEKKIEQVLGDFCKKNKDKQCCYKWLNKMVLLLRQTQYMNLKYGSQWDQGVVYQAKQDIRIINQKRFQKSQNKND